MKTQMLKMMLMLMLNSCGVDQAQMESEVNEEWNAENDPTKIAADWQRNLSLLPTSGELDKLPWSDSYWPNYLGGIARRWQDGSANAFTYALYTKTQLQAMSADQIAKLSPAEKYDIYRGRFDYPTVQFERSRTSPQDASWTGICHGWAPASIEFAQPKPVTLQTSNGINIPFGSSDVKALLSYYSGYFSPSGPKAVGLECSNSSTDTSSACSDVNAGSFHIILANKIGIKKESVVIDITTAGQQVWNQPVNEFESTILNYSNTAGASAAPGTVKEARVRTKVKYVVEISPTWDSLSNSATPVDEKVYEYTLELNAADEIIGGRWIGHDFPDVLWVQQHTGFNGSFAKLGDIYGASIQ